MPFCNLVGAYPFRSMSLTESSLWSKPPEYWVTHGVAGPGLCGSADFEYKSNSEGLNTAKKPKVAGAIFFKIMILDLNKD